MRRCFDKRWKLSSLLNGLLHRDLDSRKDETKIETPLRVVLKALVLFLTDLSYASFSHRRKDKNGEACDTFACTCPSSWLIILPTLQPSNSAAGKDTTMRKAAVTFLSFFFIIFSTYSALSYCRFFVLSLVLSFASVSLRLKLFPLFAFVMLLSLPN